MTLNILLLLTSYTQWHSKRTTLNQQSGAILIIVLWFLIIVTAMVATLASETRLSAQIVYYNKLALQNWNDTLKALAAAQMELLINTMPEPPGQGQQVPLSERKTRRYRFDGRVLDLAYPIPDTVTVRIYDHGGKINIRLPELRMRQLLEKRIGKDPDKIAALLDAWQDWIDSDDLKRTNGAEKDYYETLSPPYEPRNSQIETVEELLLIKGFAEAFKGVEIDAAFTVFTASDQNFSGSNQNRYQVNPNLATREALMLLPGLNEDLVNTILTKRREKEFKNMSDFNEFMQPEQLVEITPWMDFNSGTALKATYTIAIQTKNSETIDEKAKPESSEKKTKDNFEKADNQENNTTDSSSSESEPQQQRAYLVTVQPTGNNQKPKVLMVNPYGVLPDTRYETLVNQDDKSGKKQSTSENLKSENSK
ncbi:general secretory pathway protein K [Thioploca ingrica]|uniref:General secretory pathway protein K n=1 Tax=Thioploca ingrica TaxID=40754 RepID=A0A090AEZ1_9GAMM|nr:general secretory pathway protein K [Thioploca ingrica]